MQPSEATPPTYDKSNGIIGPNGPTRSLLSNRAAVTPPQTTPPPAPSACDSPKINPGAAGDVVNAVDPRYTIEVERDRKRFRKEAPHRIVPWKPLQHVITKHLGICRACSSCPLRLEEVTTCAFTSVLELVCDKCSQKEKAEYQHLKYLERKLETQTGNKREILKQQYYRRNKYKKMINLSKERRIEPLTIDNFLRNDRRDTVLNYELNVRAIMASFYCGTGGNDIAKAASFLGVPGGKSWERSFSRHSPQVSSIIGEVTTKLIDTALIDEIKATLVEKLKGSDHDREKVITAFLNNDEQNIPGLVKKLELTVSYDMGWQKRSTGKVYDSISGHGFMIGCRTGNVIGFRVK